MVRATLVAGMAVCAVFGQPAAGPLSFEVASLKPSPPGNLMVRMGNAPGRLDYTNVSLKLMMQRACEVQDFQISGPDWMASARFDMVAKPPEGVPVSRAPEMLRSLLAERFKLAVHRDARELSVYALIVGRNGPKMKEAEADPNTPPAEAARRPSQSGSPQAAPPLDCGPTGERATRAGWYVRKKPGLVEGHGMNMASLVNLLSALMGRPVLDQTGLTGNYDFNLEFVPDEVQPPPPAAGAPLEALDLNGVSLMQAIQSQLGLKLESRKSAMELIVVDHAEKIPTGN